MEGGLTLWRLYIEHNDRLSLLRSLSAKGVKCVTYADDLLLLVEGSNRLAIKGGAAE